jgi:hypothetical protein
MAAAPQAACQKVVVGAGPDYPPLRWYDGKALHGASVMLTQRVFADMGVPVELRYVRCRYSSRAPTASPTPAGPTWPSPCMRYFKEFDRRLGLLIRGGGPEPMIEPAMRQWRADPRTVR